MKISKKIVSLGAALALVACLGASLAVADNTDPNAFVADAADGAAACAECGATDGHADACSLAESGEVSLYDQLMAAEDVEGMYALVLAAMQDAPDSLDALTSDEINALLDRVEALDPYGVASDTDALAEALISLPNFISGAEADGEKSAILGTGTVSETVTGADFMNARNSSNIVKLTADTTVTSYINVAADQTLVIDLNGYALISNVGDSNSLIDCKGTVTIKSSNMTREHRGTMVKVTRWVDKRTNYSVYGEKYNNSSVYYDRYIQVKTDEAELWSYDGTGSTVIKGGVITGASAHTYGGAIRVRSGGTLNLESGTIAGNATYRKIVYDATTNSNLTEDSNGDPTGLFYTYGGAIHVGKDATFNMNGGTISYNWCDYYGGAVCLDGSNATMNMTSGVITDNCAQGSGGGIGVRNGSILNLGTDRSVDYSVTAAPVVSYNRTFDKNYTGGGGGTAGTSSTLNYETGSIEYNQSSGSGAGIYCYRGGSVNASSASSRITNNYAGGSGGAIFLQYGDVKLDGCILNNNESKGSAGAVGIRVGNFVMTGGEIKDNKANDHGGAVYVSGQNNITPHGDPGYLSCSASITGTVISGNTSAKYGGAVYVNVMNSSADCSVDLDGCQILNNKAGQRGGAVYLCGGTLTVKGASTLVQENTAPNGGAFYVEESDRTSSGLAKNYYVYKVIKEGWKEFDDLTEDDVERITDPAIALKTAKAYIKAGTFENNEATSGNGGVLYVTGTKAEVYMSGGSMIENRASLNGGAIYVGGGNFNMSAGVLASNAAGDNGGAAYVSGGNVVMSNGEMMRNQAANGGAIYVADGDFTIKHGKLNANTAVNGGAVYMAGDDDTVFRMESGEMNNNVANLDAEGEGGDGGAIYATGGTLYIGLENCTGPIDADKDGQIGAEEEKSTNNDLHGSGKHHPQLKGNTAGDCGGGISVTGEGVVHFFCGSATDNAALYKGTGLNVFMNGGEFYFYDGTNVGIPRDPDLVIIGGELHNKTSEVNYIKLVYYANNIDKGAATMQGLAAPGECMNLPSGEYFFNTPTGMRFFGWTAQGSDSASGSEYVRDKDQYKPSGSAVVITDEETAGTAQNTYDGESDQTMHLYALWAPADSNITYVDGMTFKEVQGTPIEYTFSETDQTIEVNAIDKKGYALVGWYVYQNEDQNANWGLEPIYVNGIEKTYANLNYDAMKNEGQYLSANDDGSLNLEVDGTNFGDITLIADYVPLCLTINKSVSGVVDPNQAFVFQVKGQAGAANASVDMIVSLTADELAAGKGSVTIEQIPAGTYTVTELTDWSWRYEMSSGSSDSSNVTIGGVSKKAASVSFANVRDNGLWLSGDSVKNNIFAAING